MKHQSTGNPLVQLSMEEHRIHALHESVNTLNLLSQSLKWPKNPSGKSDQNLDEQKAYQQAIKTISAEVTRMMLLAREHAAESAIKYPRAWTNTPERRSS